MSESKCPEQIFNNPHFQRLIKSRQRVCCLLSFQVFAIYALFTLLMAYAPDSLEKKVWDGSAITFGILYSLLAIVLMVALSSFYTWWANTRSDQLKKELLDSINYTAGS